MPRRAAVSALAVAGALGAGCGGGSSGPGGLNPNTGAPPDDPAPGVSFDVAAAWRQLLAADRSWALAGTGSDGNPYTVTVRSAAAVAGTLPTTGAAATVAVTTLRIEGPGGVTAIERRAYLEPSSRQVLALEWQGEAAGSPCDVTLEPGVPPGAATIPSSGLLARLSRRASCAPGAADTGEVVEFGWSLRQEAGVNLFCLDRDVLGLTDPTRLHCAEVAPDGTLGARGFVSLELGGNVSVEAATP